MKILVSYLSSNYSSRETLELIDKTSASGIHADLMDGEYVPNKNFEVFELPELYANLDKEIEFHLMVKHPSRYIKLLSNYNPTCIYIHPRCEKDPISVLDDINKLKIDPGIAINPNELISRYEELFSHVKRVLLMSVYPGLGGQRFLSDTVRRLKELKDYQKKYNFEIYIDGGINNRTIKYVKEADGIISGSFICKSDNYQDRINELKDSVYN